jgi:hypothetical protein
MFHLALARHVALERERGVDLAEAAGLLRCMGDEVQELPRQFDRRLRAEGRVAFDGE